MAKVTGSNQAILNIPEWHSYQVELSDNELTGTPRVLLDKLPAGTYFAGAKVLCFTGDVGATSCGADIKVGALDLLTTAVDALGAASFTQTSTAAQFGLMAGSNSLTLNAEADLCVDVSWVGTGTTAPNFVVMVQLGRREL